MKISDDQRAAMLEGRKKAKEKREAVWFMTIKITTSGFL